ncbi:hypothetical protein B7C42_04576 [Nocardia cerradoensis]|uniref:Uncharacterized protein n=1 Tax=Nocardia cerradoensis TaxID=85688 RepID=A0A231H2T8_9NOCA|nr:hypothetical protein B7C42_04576 [Nocardia cerradoensis]
MGSNATGSGTAFCLRLLPESVEALRESGGTSLTELSGERVQAAMNEYAVTLPWNADFFGALERMVERWVRYFFDHPVERALTAASTLENGWSD